MREVAPVPNEASPCIERRRGVRYPTNDAAEVEIFPQAVAREDALILDVSRSGVRVHLKTKAPSGAYLKIRLLKTNLLIFGEVRYCRPVADGFDAGVRIEHVFGVGQELGKHLHDRDFLLYASGKGLTAEEVIVLRDHLVGCEACRIRCAKIEAALEPRLAISKQPGTDK